MAKKVFYEQVIVGKKKTYVPVSEYDNDLMSSLTDGSHLVTVVPGGKSYRFDIDPAYAPMLAAGKIAEDAICKAISKASGLKPQRTPVTPAQTEAWDKLIAAFGGSICTLQGPSMQDCARAGVDAMQSEAEKLMKHESVKQAYEQFMLVAALTKDGKVS